MIRHWVRQGLLPQKSTLSYRYSSSLKLNYEDVARRAVALSYELGRCGEITTPIATFRTDLADYHDLLSFMTENATINRGHIDELKIAHIISGRASRIFRAAMHPSLNLQLGKHVCDLLKGHVSMRNPDLTRAAADAFCELGVYQTDVGMYSSANESLREGLRILNDHHASSIENDANATISRAKLQLNLGRLLAKGAGMGKGYEIEARLLLERALHSLKTTARNQQKQASADLGELDLLTAECKAALALVLTCQQEHLYSQAEQLIEEAVATQGDGGDAIALSESMNVHGLLLARQRRNGEARHVFKQNLALRLKLYHTNLHPAVAESLMNCASIESNPSSALERYEQAVSALSIIYTNSASIGGSALSLSLAPALDGQGVALCQLGRSVEAATVFRKALNIRRTFISHHADTAASCTNLAHALISIPPSLLDHFSDGEVRRCEVRNLLMEAITINRALDKKSVLLAMALINFVEYSYSQSAANGQESGAAALDAHMEAMCSEALGILSEQLGETHPSTQAAKELLDNVALLRAELLQQQGRKIN